MLINRDHKLFGKVVLKDCQGSHITVVKSYDTATKVAQVYLLGRQDSRSTKMVMVPVQGKVATWEPVIMTVYLPGSKLCYISTGEDVPEADL